MAALAILLLAIVGYLASGAVLLRWLRGTARDIAFALLNVAGVYYFFFSRDHRHQTTFLVYLGLVTVQYVALWLFGRSQGRRAWLAFLLPILALVVTRYTPSINQPGAPFLYAPYLIGISYLAFRSSYLVLEVRNGSVPFPTFFQYVGFCLFLPTISVGPINPYSNHLRAFAPTPPPIPCARAALRILVGLVKYKYLGMIFFQLTYANFLNDDHLHRWIDIPLSAVFFYFYLYCNFSGFCDLAIGAAGLMGVPVAENFNSPFAARNLKEFWNRWHMTLSTYMRDVVFAPLSRYLTRLFGPAHLNHAVALSITVVFLLVGLWHGVGWNFVILGALHGVGVSANHYYTVGLKKWLGPSGFKSYMQNPWIRAGAVAITFCYVSASLLFFAMTLPQMLELWAVLR